MEEGKKTRRRMSRGKKVYDRGIVYISVSHVALYIPTRSSQCSILEDLAMCPGWSCTNKHPAFASIQIDR